MLKEINFASLKPSGSLLAIKATMKLIDAKRPRYPNMHQNAMGDPSLHSKLMSVGCVCVLTYWGNGGASNTQRIHKIICKKEHMDRNKKETQRLVHIFSRLPGFVAMKANTTVIVFAKMQETQSVKTMPNADCRRRHFSAWGTPMKAKEQRKHRVNEKRRKQLRW